MWECLTQLVGSGPFQSKHDLSNCNRRWKSGEQVNVVRLYDQFQNTTTQLLNLLRDQVGKVFANIARQNRTAIFWTPDQVVVNIVVRVSRSFTHSQRIFAHYPAQSKYSFSWEGGSASPPGLSRVSPPNISMGGKGQ